MPLYQIHLKVTPHSRTELVQVVQDLWQELSLNVKVTAPPEKGKANKAVLTVLSDFFDMPISRLSIEAGKTSRYKILVVSGTGAEIDSFQNKLLDKEHTSFVT